LPVVQQVQFHSPQYWSHLVYIGTPPRTGTAWAWWGLGTLVLLGGGAWWWRRQQISRAERESWAALPVLGAASASETAPPVRLEKSRHTSPQKADSGT
jgi:cytoskeletal protein RodZ